MKVILFGATGMVGQGVLRECLLDPDVEKVLAIGRGPSGKKDPKLEDLVHTPLDDLSAVADKLAGYDACFFCLGVSSAGMSEAAYRKITLDLTISAARTLYAKNPNLVFVYVSGQSTDTNGKAMWKQVKGQTEDQLLAIAPGRAFMFRPGIIIPLHGIVSKTLPYRIAYILLWPFMPLMRWLFPASMTTTEKVGRAMLTVAREGAGGQRPGSPLLEIADINAAAATPAPRRLGSGTATR